MVEEKHKQNNDKCQCECKKAIKYCVCKEDYAWNPRICVCEYYKDCGIGKHLKDCACTKYLIDDLVDTCDETVDTSETTSINSTNQTNCWLLCVLL